MIISTLLPLREFILTVVISVDIVHMTRGWVCGLEIVIQWRDIVIITLRGFPPLAFAFALSFAFAFTLAFALSYCGIVIVAIWIEQ
jgi:hypothetical protein